ncbi:MAG: hypothetical protein FJY85_04870, partial [Deltaproteobacteria bacterium]|nr:hypothetical protein [Deltaproteobacteria bacterium]
MGEIRSTIDLIMERTRGMSLSTEEKESFRREELQKKARGFRLKLLQTPSHAVEILSAVDHEPQENRGVLLSFIWKNLIDGMIDEAEPLKTIQVLERLPQAVSKKPLLGEFRSALNTAIRQKSKDH